MSELPALRVLRPLQWSVDADGAPRLVDPRSGQSARYVAWTADLFRDVQEGRAMADVLARYHDADQRAKAKRLLFTLMRVGYVALEPPVPKALDRYEPERLLGLGAFGIAYLARDGDERVVVKRAWDFLVPMDAARAALEREAATLARLDHPDVVKLRGRFVEDGALHLVRSYAPGASLDDRDAPFWTRPGEERARAALAAARIVAHVHERGMLLLDHGPGNYAVRDDGVTLLDVGHAMPMDGARTRVPRGIGTAGYVAPETLRAGEASAASDVWGVGRLFALLASGAPPAKAETLDDVVAPLVPAHAALVRALCAEDPAARPDASEAAALIARALAPRPASA